MAWLVVDEDGTEGILADISYLDRENGEWTAYGYCDIIRLPYGSIEKLIGKELTWEDEPYELKEAAE